MFQSNPFASGAMGEMFQANPFNKGLGANSLATASTQGSQVSQAKPEVPLDSLAMLKGTGMVESLTEQEQIQIL
jgi:hypothetical protein